MKADFGDWIVKGAHGEFHLFKDSIFRETYGPAGAATVTPSGTAARHTYTPSRDGFHEPGQCLDAEGTSTYPKATLGKF